MLTLGGSFGLRTNLRTLLREAARQWLSVTRRFSGLSIELQQQLELRMNHLLEAIDPNNQPRLSQEQDAIREFVSDLSNKTGDHLSHRLRSITQGLGDIRKRPWVVKPADKNLGLVLMTKAKYDELVHGQLTADGVFETVNFFPHKKIMARMMLNLRISPFSPEVRKKILDRARERDAPCPFYILPKIHKPKLAARPITAQHSYALAGLSKLLSKKLNDEVAKHAGVTKNSKTVAAELEEIYFPPGELIFATYDVVSLYPSIDIADALATLKEAFPEIFSEQDGFWLRCLKVIMEENYVTYEGKFFRQTRGTATGTACAPAFANLYLLAKFHPTFLKHGKGILYNRRYIDDGFIVLTDRTTAMELKEELSTCSNLELTWTFSNKGGIYLDLEIYAGPRRREDGRLDLKIYTKPISKFLYLHGISDHPRHVFTGIVKGEMIRFLRNTSDEKTWLKSIAFLFTMLRQRGYTATWLRKARDYVHWNDRARYLRDAEPKDFTAETAVRVPFHPMLNPSFTALAMMTGEEGAWAKPRLVYTKGKTILGASKAKVPPPDTWEGRKRARN